MVHSGERNIATARSDGMILHGLRMAPVAFRTQGI
jgi:hypothetical protein